MRSNLRALRERIRQVEAGGHRDTPLRRAYNHKLRAYRVLRGGGGLPHTHAPDMIHDIHFKSLDKHDKDSFTFTFTYESHGESRDFTVKVLSNKLIHRKNRSQVYVRLNCDDDKSNPDPDKCHIEISDKDNNTTQTLSIPYWVQNFSLELYKRFILPYSMNNPEKSTEAMIPLSENESVREEEKNVWQELNSTRDKMQEQVQPLLTKTHLNMREYNDLERFLENLSQDRYKGDKYQEFNEKLNANKEEYERQKNQQKEKARLKYQKREMQTEEDELKKQRIQDEEDELKKQ